jgi:ATP-dependent DNA ligase
VLKEGAEIQSWSRYGEPRGLPAHLWAQIDAWPDGVYDGELLVPGGTSSDVKATVSERELRLVIFDVLKLGRNDCTNGMPYSERRKLLDFIVDSELPMQSSETFELNSADDVDLLTVSVWNRGGEGLILKRKASSYKPAKRSKDWLKIKKLHTAVVTLVGYQLGLLGPQAVVVVRDSEGFQTTVKTLNNAERAKLEAEPNKFIGKKLVIEYQERTADGSYRHPRWDRWAEDNE